MALARATSTATRVMRRSSSSVTIGTAGEAPDAAVNHAHAEAGRLSLFLGGNAFTGTAAAPAAKATTTPTTTPAPTATTATLTGNTEVRGAAGHRRH